MTEHKLTVAGLGPGTAGLITRETWACIHAAEHIRLRTRIHPTVSALDAARISYESYDTFYETADDFQDLYERIASDLIRRVQQGENILYLVPGSPFVAERTVQLLRERAAGEHIVLRILPAMSFLEPLFAVLGIDPVHGLTIVDAMDEEGLSVPLQQDMVVTQIYEREIASRVKLSLMKYLSDTHEVICLHHLALPDESIRRIPLFEMDRQHDIDHLTTLFVPNTKNFI